MKRIILDTDIGSDVDDAMALSLVASSPELLVEGITTVHADAPLRARIARRVLEYAGRSDIPVVAGASIPLQMPLPEKFHWMPRLRGHEGKGILTPDELQPTADLVASADDAALFIIEKARAHPGELSLITIGAHTNVGRALQLEPRLPEWIRDITIMGGVVDTDRFTWAPLLETNLNCDPLASELVFKSGIPLTLVPMEVTTQVFLTHDMRADMRRWNHPLTNALVNMMEEMLDSFSTLSEELDLPADFYEGRTFMHDPLAIYCSMATELVAVRRMHVQLEVIDRVVRTMPYAERTPNINVCIQVDAQNFVGFWMQRIRKLVMKN
jgi:purine nucleosidase